MQKTMLRGFSSLGLCLLGLLGTTLAKADGDWHAGSYTVVSQDEWVATEGVSYSWLPDSPYLTANVDTNNSAATITVVYKRHFEYTGDLPISIQLYVHPTAMLTGSTAYASGSATAAQSISDSTDTSDPYSLSSTSVPWNDYKPSTTDPTITLEVSVSSNNAHFYCFRRVNCRLTSPANRSYPLSERKRPHVEIPTLPYAGVSIDSHIDRQIDKNRKL